MIRNDTKEDYQLVINVGDEYLEGEWRASAEPLYRYEIVERNHTMQSEFWGGYTRHNELYQQIYDIDGNLLSDKLLLKNSAIMMYTPFLEENTKK
jgi:vancomycin resistance protein VanW